MTLMKEALINTDIEARDSGVFNPEIRMYGLSIPGTPFVAEGESLQVLKEGKKLLDEVRPEFVYFNLNKERFIKNPISNLTLKIDEVDGRVENKSWISGVDGFKDGVFECLTEPGAMTMRLLDLNKELVDLSGVEQMVEIGFNVGGEELVFKRILLPTAFSDQVTAGKLGEIWEGRSEKMPEVFLRAWEMLGVEEYDSEWNKLVIEQLKSNVRDLDKEIRYKMVDGKKLVYWGDQWLWAGLLSDKYDIERFLIEEKGLAELKPGEVMVTYYSHNSGALSAGTKGETPEEEKQVGDVQMMGENGEVFQKAVEGNSEEIEELVENLINNMRKDYGLEELKTGVVLSEVLPMSNLSGVWELPIGMKREWGEIGKVREEWISLAENEHEENISSNGLEKREDEWVIMEASEWENSNDDGELVIEKGTVFEASVFEIDEMTEWSFKEDVVGEFDWPDDGGGDESEFDWPDDGGGDEPGFDSDSGGGGGGKMIQSPVNQVGEVVVEEVVGPEWVVFDMDIAGEQKLEEEIVEILSKVEGQVKQEQAGKEQVGRKQVVKKGEIIGKNTIENSAKVLTEETVELARGMVELTEETVELTEEVVFEVGNNRKEREVVEDLRGWKEVEKEEEEIPVWEWGLSELEAIGEKDIPEWNLSMVWEELNWSLTTSALKTVEQGVDGAEWANEQNLKQEFEYYADLTSVVGAVLFLIANTFRGHIRVPVLIGNQPLMEVRGSGLMVN